MVGMKIFAGMPSARAANATATPFVTKLNAAGSALSYSTFLGGSDQDGAVGIAVDATGSAWITGFTFSADFPTTPDAFDRVLGGPHDAFATKLSATGSAVAYSTLLGGSSFDSGAAIAVDSAGNAYVTGSTSSTDYPTTAGAFDTTFNGAFNDAFVTKVVALRPPATLTLSPATATNTVGTTHTVTASVQDAAGGPSTDVVVRFSVAGAAPHSGSCTTDASGRCAFTYDGPIHPGSDAISAYADTNNDNARQPDEPIGAATKLWVIGPPAALTLTPAQATNPVGTAHTVTATATDAFANPTPAVAVRFSVTGSASAAGSCLTNAAGHCDFSYAGPALPGNDVIAAYADSDGDSVQDAGEPAATAGKTWILPASTAGQVSGSGQISNGAGDKIIFNFEAKSDSSLKASCMVNDLAANRKIKCVDMTAFVLTGGAVTFYGNATDNGTPTTYVIQAVDATTDTFSIRTASGYTAGGAVNPGNVKVH